MNLFIDTNIFLSFYHFTSDDLEELKKLWVLIERDELTLLLPEQVKDEFERNRDNKISDAVKILKKQNLSLQFPQICKDYEEYTALREHQKEYEKLHSGLISKITEDVNNETLKADEVVNELFDRANLLSINDEVLNNVKIRMKKGNPPGKSGSFGDAINWEILLNNAGGENLFFVSDDRDYSSSVNDLKFNSFLSKEWAKQNDSEIIFYKRLSAFLKDEFPNIKLANELEKELLIQELETSPNFFTTHSIIAKLQKFDVYSEAQINDIVSASISNNQVHWIIGDEDVYKFLSSIIVDYKDKIKEDNYNTLKKYLEKVDKPEDDPLDFLFG